MKRLWILLLLLGLSACAAGETPAVPATPTPQAAETESTEQEETRLKITVGDEALPATFRTTAPRRRSGNCWPRGR